MEKPLKVRLHILSPVHIGCDDVYEPTNFVIDEKKKSLITFDPLEFVKSLSSQDKKNFLEICSQGSISSIVSLYKFLSTKQVQGREINVASGLITHYKKVRDLPINQERNIKHELNQFTINRTAYNPYNNLPFIPGSSIKGAMRTAYLNKMAIDKGVKGRNNRAREMEIELLDGSFDKDPFRMVKISDFLPIDDIKTKIVYAVNKKKKKSDYEARGPFQILEVIEEGAVFEGIINIDTPDKKTGINNPIKIQALLKSISEFYNMIFEREHNVLKEIGAGLVKLKNPFTLSTIIRIARYSGAESVTIDGNRYIKIMQGRGQQPKNLDRSTTIWLASELSKPNNNNNLLPFGWALLENIPFDFKNVYPSRIAITNCNTTRTEEVVVNHDAIAKTKTIQPQVVLWENATLVWSPGDLTLKANNKAILKFKSREEAEKFVPEAFHKQLFDKKSTTANVAVEQNGNAFKIVRIE